MFAHFCRTAWCPSHVPQPPDFTIENIVFIGKSVSELPLAILTLDDGTKFRAKSDKKLVYSFLHYSEKFAFHMTV